MLIGFAITILFLQTGFTITDQMDLHREQVKMLAGEVALCTSSLKRLSEQAATNPEDSQLRVRKLFKSFSKPDWYPCGDVLMVILVKIGTNAKVEG